MMAIPTSATNVRVTIHAQGIDVFTVPRDAPRSTSESVIREGRDSSFLIGRPGSRIARDKVFVRFVRDASLEDRQAAIESVSSTVIGGGFGEYYIRIPVPPGDRTTAAVTHSIRTLRTQPGVAAANIDMPDGPMPNGR